jgi:hypothetical protein
MQVALITAMMLSAHSHAVAGMSVMVEKSALQCMLVQNQLAGCQQRRAGTVHAAHSSR